MLRRLTDNYKKEDSNISKLYTLIEEAAGTVNWEKIRLWRGVKHAEGETLDLIGSNVDQGRGRVNDTVYRSLIRAKILQNKSNGTINEMIELLAFVLQVDPSDIDFKQGYEFNDEPAFILLDGIPSQDLAPIGLTTTQVKQILNIAAAGGVRVDVAFIFNTWGAVSQYTWGDINTLTWGQVKEEELSGSILPE